MQSVCFLTSCHELAEEVQRGRPPTDTLQQLALGDVLLSKNVGIPQQSSGWPPVLIPAASHLIQLRSRVIKA